ncbi:hypothetical protein [Polyangium sp. y55x31]|uniref:hypothetical protein n=1 Tax=Polyangium sp. y55x31 TaxID=3042688 RepID=UPI0024825914|nr:hypothetical protein [Polyangium sp. y55x31]
MKKVLEIIAVMVVVLCLISAGVLLSRGRPGSGAPAAPGSAEDEAPAPTLLGGAP